MTSELGPRYNELRADTDEKEAIYTYIYIVFFNVKRERDIIRSSWWENHIISLIPFNYTPCIPWLPRRYSCIETGSLYLEDQCFSIATIWRQSNNNTSLWLSVFSPLFSLHPLAAAATKSLWKSYSIIHTQTLICLIYLLFRPSLLFNAFCSRYVARTTRHHRPLYVCNAIERV